jgi:hypothetical protein
MCYSWERDKKRLQLKPGPTRFGPRGSSVIYATAEVIPKKTEGSQDFDQPAISETRKELLADGYRRVRVLSF